LSTLSENINRINAKLQQLLKQYQLVQRENEQLTQTVKELKDHSRRQFAPHQSNGTAGRDFKIRCGQNE